MMLRYLFAALCLCLLLVSPAAAAGGAGTAANPYIIETPAELQSIANNLAAYYVLANDIDMSGVTSWTPIGSSSAPFTGSLDGNNHIIKNLQLSINTDNFGIFGYLSSGAIIKNMYLNNCEITSSGSFISVLVSHIAMSDSVHNTATIQNININDCSISASSQSGFLISTIESYAYVNIIDCVISDCSLSSSGGTAFIGAIVGSIGGYSNVLINGGSVENTKINGASAGDGCLVGYIVGSDITINNIDVLNSLVTTPNYGAGGIIGRSNNAISITITDCLIDNCIVSGVNYCGGIVGYIQGSVTTISINTCTLLKSSVFCSNTYAGGIIGRSNSDNADINNCVVSGCSIIATNSVSASICGGFV